MLKQTESGDCVIASDKPRSITSFLECAFEHICISDWESRVNIDERLIRKVDVKIPYGNPAKAERVLGWKPGVVFRLLVALMIDAALERLGSSISDNN